MIYSSNFLFLQLPDGQMMGKSAFRPLKALLLSHSYWDIRARTETCRNQKPVPYHLAISH